MRLGCSEHFEQGRGLICAVDLVRAASALEYGCTTAFVRRSGAHLLSSRRDERCMLGDVLEDAPLTV